MASATAIEAGGAFVRIFVDDAQANATLTALQTRVRRFADEVASVGKGLALTGAGLGVPLTRAMKVFSGFADKMSAVRAIVQAADEDFSRLNDTVKKLAGSFIASQAADGMLELARVGFDVNEVMGAMPGTLNLARAGVMDMGEATAILANTIRSFNLSAGDADWVGDILAKTANSSTTTVKGIGDAMKHVASSAELSGQSIEQMSAALGILANRGLAGELAGTALARTLVKLADTDTKAMLKHEFNIGVADAKGNMRDLLDIMRDLGNAARMFGNSEKLALFKDLFDQRGMKGAINLSENIQEWDRLTQTLKTAEGTAAEIARGMDDNLGGAIRRMTAAGMRPGNAAEPRIRWPRPSTAPRNRWSSPRRSSASSSTVSAPPRS